MKKKENKRKKQLHAAWPYLSACTCTAARHWPANVPGANKCGPCGPQARQQPASKAPATRQLN